MFESCRVHHNQSSQCHSIVSNITQIETIARGAAVRDLKRLRKQFGGLRWRKLKELQRCGWQLVG